MDDIFSQDVAVDGVRPGNQFILAMVAGVTTAFICTLLWVVVAFFAGPRIDYLALGVGALIGLSIRFSGKGTSPLYGLVAMPLTLISTVAGNILGVIASGSHEHLDIFDVAKRVNLVDVITSILQQATPITYLIFIAAVVLSFLIAVKR